jgi:hypothetical protein
MERLMNGDRAMNTLKLSAAISIGVYLAFLAALPPSEKHPHEPSVKPSSGDTSAAPGTIVQPATGLDNAKERAEGPQRQPAQPAVDAHALVAAAPATQNARESQDPYATSDAEAFLAARRSQHQWSEQDETQMQAYLTQVSFEDYQRLLALEQETLIAAHAN